MVPTHSQRTACVIPLSQGLSLNLDLGWQPANPPASGPSSGVRGLYAAISGLLFLMCTDVYLHVYMCTHMPGAPGGQKRPSDPLELDLELEMAECWELNSGLLQEHVL